MLFGSDATESIEYLKGINESPDIETSKISFESLQTDIIPVKFLLQFSERVENLIIYNSIFRKFISGIERGLNEFFKHEKISFENKVFLEEDWEIPNLEKLVLSLKIKGISFKQEMNLWKRINDVIYERIKSEIINSSEENAAKLKELKKKFYIKLEM